MKMKYCLIFCTFPTKEKAVEISKILLNKKLIACSTIIPSFLSIYKWEGKIEEAEEYLCIFKTKEKLFDEIEKEIKERHPYEVPEILMLEIKKGTKNYLKWIDECIEDKL